MFLSRPYSSILLQIYTNKLIGAGPGILDAISGIVARTLLWIETDMPKDDIVHQTPAAGSPSVSSLHTSPTPVQTRRETHANRVATQNPGSQSTTTPFSSAVQSSALSEHPSHSSSQPTSQQHQHDSTYYSGHGLDGQEAYSTLPHSDQHQSNNIGAQGYDSEADIYYGNQSQHAATTVSGSGHDVQPNPLITFASQATHQVDPAAEQLMWQRPGANAWQEWTAAIADSQDRYGAGALLTLGSAPTTAPVSGTSIATMGNSGQPTVHDMTAQWPLVIFDNHGHDAQNYQNSEEHRQDHPI